MQAAPLRPENPLDDIFGGLCLQLGFPAVGNRDVNGIMEGHGPHQHSFSCKLRIFRFKYPFPDTLFQDGNDIWCYFRDCLSCQPAMDRSIPFFIKEPGKPPDTLTLNSKLIYNRFHYLMDFLDGIFFFIFNNTL